MLTEILSFWRSSARMLPGPAFIEYFLPVANTSLVSCFPLLRASIDVRARKVMSVRFLCVEVCDAFRFWCYPFKMVLLCRDIEWYPTARQVHIE